MAILFACDDRLESRPETATAPPGNDISEAPGAGLNSFGENFVRLALALGEHDSDYVDAYQGPDSWRDEAASQAVSLKDIVSAADHQLNRLHGIRIGDEITGRRHAFLLKQFESLKARASILEGKSYTFDQESSALYDATAPSHSIAYFEQALENLNSRLPGSGLLSERLQLFREDFVIAPEKLDEVFRAAIKECRRRTLERIELPSNESFVVEYVTDKAWSAYNWFQGDAQSLIQVNTDFPIIIDRAIDLACHEGYPGHHVYNTLLEQNLLKKRGWMEFSVFPLFSPTGLIAEGSANYGIDMAFPGDERYEYEEQILFPLAGLDATRVREFYEVEALAGALDYAGNNTARRYLDGQIDGETAAGELERYALMSPDRARQRVRFIDQYRSYVINYNLGRDMVADYIERNSKTDSERWQIFEGLLKEPVLPSQLVSD